MGRHRQGHELSLSSPASANGGGHNNKHAAFAVPPVDDEDNKEGSGDGEYESFYYDSYYDGRGGGVGGPAAASPGSEDDDSDDAEEDDDPLSPNANDGLGPDTEPGDGEFVDLTEPPPFLVEQQLEEELAKISQKNSNKNNKGQGSRHKFDRGQEGEDEIIIVEEFATTTTSTRRPSGGRTSGADSGRSSVSLALVVVALAAVWLSVGSERR